MHKFLEKFALVAKGPGMYFPNGQLTEATNFVAGMDFMQDRSLGEAFGKWLLKNELESKSSVYWPTLVVYYMDKKNIKVENQVQEFLDLFSRFLDECESE